MDSRRSSAAERARGRARRARKGRARFMGMEDGGEIPGGKGDVEGWVRVRGWGCE
jgi:hypothetical protein